MARMGWCARSASALCFVVATACGDDDGTTLDGSMMDASMMDTSMMADTSTTPDSAAMDTSVTPGECIPPAPNQPPDLLSCTGLYSNIVNKTLADGVREFAPAVALWSDGAEKTRWIYLPPGETIDVSNPDAWSFPAGTRFFKEFKWEGKRVETRLYWKVSNDNPLRNWVRTAYKWNANETEGTRTGGEDVVVNGDAYHIPSTTECDRCHNGRLDRALGFEAVLLGLPGATGVTLSDLVDEDLVSGGTLPTTMTIADDGSGHGTEALGWLHVNCGVSCHNANSTSDAYSTGLRLRLSVSDADGSNPSGSDPISTSVNQAVVTGRWVPGTRIIPGNPDDSLLYQLMSTRNANNLRDQMPPIASRVVPPESTLIYDWILEMGNGNTQDAGN